MLRRILFAFAALAVLLGARAAFAQQTDVIRGRVVGPDSQPLQGVQVTATSLSGNVNRKATTDRNGRYTVTFPNGEGDYFVNFAILGYAPRRFEVKRMADEDILVADAKLQTQASTLDAVKVTAPRDRVARGDNPPDISGGDRTINNQALTAAQLGDLAAMAASLPGVTLVPGADGDPSGFSVLGLTPDQNNTTLNGQNFGGSNLPRDAGISSSLNTTPYDVSRGGFSGGSFNIRTRPGTNFLSNGMSLNLDSPKLQWTDAAGRANGQQYSNASLGGQFSGPLKYDQAFYNISYQLGRRSNDLFSLLNTDPVGLQANGIASDSVKRLLNIMSGLRVPTVVGHLPNSRLSDQGSILAALDVAPPTSRTGQSYNVTMQGSWNKTSPVLAAASELPAHSGDRTNWSGGIQGRHNAYFGFGVLTETTVGFSDSRNYGTPYLALPSGNVRINSSFSDGTNGVKSVAFGGSSVLATSQATTSLNFTNQLSWFSENNKHRLKLTTELRRDGYSVDQSVNQLGSLTYNSLADVQANRPSFFSRVLSPRKRDGSQIVGGIALGDSYKRNNDLQLQYGVRLDGNYFGDKVTYNPQVESIFGVRNDFAPSKLYVSPRIGFSWTYGTAPQIAGFDGAARGPRAVVRGGIGVFQNTPQTTMLGTVIDNTGLPSGLQQVNCTGIAVPTVDWAAWGANPASIPTQCADGTQGTVFASTVPNVSMYAKDYQATRSLRSNLQWNGPILNNRFTTTVEATYSLNMNQPGAVDLNFTPTQRFALANEGNRPVYVQPTSIDAPSGAIASRDARKSQLFNRVTENRSDLKSESKQLSLRLSPATFSQTWSWSLNYVYSTVQERVRGFTSTVGNPLDVEWARSAFDSHHQIQYSLGYNFFDAVRVNWFGSFRSGSPFTPLISGDVNGDGYSNDRAFIFNPATAGTDASVASSMTSLLAKADGNVRSCLQKQMGKLADRNSCEGPWTTSASLSISFNPLKLHLPQRATLSFSVSNPLGAADLLLHGEKNMRGWGQSNFPDQQLLYVRGFDPATKNYKYEVNQRFGNTSPAVNAARNPVTVTAMMRFDLAPTRERQNLTQQLDRGRRTQGTRLPEPMIKAIYGTGGIVNPMSTILRQSDTLKLTATQADSLATLNRWYSIRVDSIWTPVAKTLSTLPDNYDKDIAYHLYRKAREASVDLLLRITPSINSLLTGEQKRKLPSFITAYLDPRYLASIRSGTAGGNNAFQSGGGGGPVMMGGGGAEMVVIRR